MEARRAIEAELRAEADPERAVKEKAYLKSEMTHLGVKVPLIRKITKKHVRGLEHDDVVALVEALWAPDIHELRMAAVEAVLARWRVLGPADVPLLERLLRESKTWALVDALAVSGVGRLVERHPELGAVLDRWAEDDDFWIRRSAMLALLKPLRTGAGDWARFTRYADAMLEEKEFFIRKAIGWILREAGRKNPARVDAWITPRVARASGVTMREAVKPLPEARREALMATYRAR